ncbi:hypothetical protein DUNSADRAFT_17383 [Dunaliella salina]|uniref:Encoded protein n=1 Tax=Dunaliella salina TaxID=3046 RepID=A0ABQ7G1V2_DUNSA|nr:hypothetical protein DUNSADRAFT_17383 [Dunaliella salina]|eukprot:KAF5828586.1 hypothetical protein DUNSADRAFT_17383 [Dunaliella salina]
MMTHDMQIPGDSNEDSPLPTRASHSFSSNTFTLPPLKKNARGAWEESIEGVPHEWRDGASPARRGRKSNLAANTEEPGRSVVAASIEVDAREKDMHLTRDNRHATGRLMMELWVNQVLDPAATELSGKTEPNQVNVAMLKGLARFGLTRTELSGAGLTNEAIDRVYRCLYVYTIGFFDVMQVWV